MHAYETYLRAKPSDREVTIEYIRLLRYAGNYRRAEQLCDRLLLADPQDAVVLSARTGAGLDQLRRKLLQAAGWQVSAGGIYTARERHVQALRRVQEHVGLAQAHLAAQAHALDLMAEELRLAQQALAEIVGAWSDEDLLGAIFGRFCIGK